MPVHPHLKIVIRGVFLNTPEEWSFGLKFSKDNALGQDPGVDEVDRTGVAAACHALLSTAVFPNWVQANEFRVYEIGSNGKMVGNPRIEEFITFTTRPKGTGTIVYPTDQALCVTTEAANRGHARYGRFYLPAPSTAIATDGRLSTANVDNQVTQVTNFLKSVSDSIDFPAEPFDGSSMLNISNDATATHQTVRNIRIGRVLDRIERRRRSMLEEYRESGVIDW